MSQKKSIRSRKKLWILLGLAGALVALVLGVALSVPIRSETLKARIVALLSDQLESEVTIEHLEGRVFPRVAVSGRGVMIRHRGRTDVPPLISIDSFEIRGTLRDLLRAPRHVSEVRLRGLSVQIPPGREKPAATVETGTAGEIAADERLATPPPPRQPRTSAAGSRKPEQVVIDRFEAPDTVVTLIPRRADKDPKVFTIHHLVMQSLGINQTIPYIATLTNPIPKGDIETSGTFGPWNVEEPASTPVNGKYVFANADLGTIEGLGGTLHSTGDFKGPLNRIEVAGTTETPNFQLDVGGLPVPLSTNFTAVVDGSDGDTYLTRVDAKFIDTELVARGAVIGIKGVRGRRVEIEVDMPNGRIEDLLTLAVNSEKPMLRGAVRLQAKVVVPPEKAKVIDKLNLRGEFGLSQAKFTDTSVQSKLIGLSRRGKGIAKDEPVGDVMSNLRGSFVVDKGVARFSRLTFSVPGARVELAGQYGMRTERINFRGRLRTEATMSQAVGGVKGFFLKPFDGIFRKDGSGMVLPIRIEGTRRDPKFGLDMFKKK